jgi:hypothetical protein
MMGTIRTASWWLRQWLIIPPAINPEQAEQTRPHAVPPH